MLFCELALLTHYVICSNDILVSFTEAGKIYWYHFVRRTHSSLTIKVEQLSVQKYGINYQKK